MLASVLLVAVGAAPAQAATPVYEINGRWVNPPDTIARGNPVVAEWRINVNDADEPPSNEPVENVTAEFRLDKAIFDELPDMCLTDGVTPASSISADGRTLICNFGTVRMGTAIVLQTPVVADGTTGEFVRLAGTSPGGEEVDLPPIEIRNPFAMDMHWVGTTEYEVWNDVTDPRYVDVDLEWSLRLQKGSDVGPDTARFRVRVSTTSDDPTVAVQVGRHPSDIGVPDNWDRPGCTSHDLGQADGHPYSSVPTHHMHSNFVESCTLTPVAGQPGVFDLTLSGINYELLNAPTHDSFGNALPANWNYVASGMVWFRVVTNQAGSIRLTMDPHTYQAPTGQQFADLPGNNVSNKVYTLPGGFSAAYLRNYTGNGGTRWDDTYRVSPGTTVWTYVANHFSSDNSDPTDLYGVCQALDTPFVDFDATRPMEFWLTPEEGGGERLDAPPGTLEYYTGPVPEPNTFECDAGGAAAWDTELPADPTSVTAVRLTYPFSTYSTMDAIGIQMRAPTRIHDNVEVGQDIWTFGSYLRGTGQWVADAAYRPLTLTPDYRYPHTNGRRDVVRIVTAVPFIQKSAARSTVQYGVPAEFTLTYSANGAGTIPPSVDGYVIRDELPAGMTYEEGSASPEPVVTLEGGRQVLTWTLDDVTTNTPHHLRYHAVVESGVPPGTQLTNTATSSYGGETSRPVTETVTTTANGYTTILKTADVDYIPNQNGDGVGTGSWTVAIDSFDPQTQAFTDTIDILPYNGDQRGTSFSGTYTLDEVVTPDGGTVYYTDADPASLSDDPDAEANGDPGAPSGLWTTTRPENPTAVRVVGGELVSGERFSFRVVISTAGAEPQDVYVNRAQGRAEHTELVMRTSSPLVVTDYRVVKTAEPESGSTVRPGEVIEYTVKVTQQGPVPAGAWFTDTLSGVFDDAVYNEDVATDLGTVELVGDQLNWQGEIPVGQVATITYSVTVKDVPALQTEGDTLLKNVVDSPGCDREADCTTEHKVGYFEFSKTSDPAPGRTVQVGEVVTYTVLIKQRGQGAVADASITDNLRAVLDDARWNDDLAATAGTAVRERRKLTWTGDLAVGQRVRLTYSVTVTDAGVGDDQLRNVVSTADNRGACVPAPDGNPDCTTSHQLGDYEVVKTSDPPTGSAVSTGEVITYTVTVRHIGIAPVRRARFTDKLAGVLDDANWNSDLRVSAGEAAIEGDRLHWAGPLQVGDEVTVAYSITTREGGDQHLQNVVTTPGECLPAPGQDQACTTEHHLPQVAAAGLGGTGSPPHLTGLLAGAAAMLLAGVALLAHAARRRRPTTDTPNHYVGLSDLL
ncbi:MAG TPA: hypothetical protein VHG70_06110 [Nocardioidaceae bacterium]|nr:hypothetical protein [Nocardioidaceae bacterium]